MLKALLTWFVVIAIIAVCVALMGPTLVTLVALDNPEGIGIFVALTQ